VAEALAWQEASRRFGDDPNALCSCGDVLISHMPPVYECHAMHGFVDDGDIVDWRCECPQFEPADRG